MRLKVYRMPIGFHDAYVAAPSMTAAIAAWGADADVFRRGQAELVDDPTLAEAPLAKPGTIVKRLRGTAAEQIAALGEADAPARPASEGAKKRRPAKRPKPKPRPSRTALGKAEQATTEAEARHERQRKAVAERAAALARERKAMEKQHAGERDRLEARRIEAEAAYEEAMRRWRET